MDANELTPPPSPGYRIRIMRKEKGWKQEKLASALKEVDPNVDISTPMISLYESNQNQPTSATWDALAGVFGVSLDWLRCRSEIRNPDQQLAALNFPEDVLSLARKLSYLPTGWRREIAGYTDELIELVSVVRREQIKKLLSRAGSEGVENWEKRHGIKITK